MKPAFTSRIASAIIVSIAALGFAGGEAHAQAQGLATVGPTDPGNGFPQFYQDRTGRALEPCLDSLNPADPCAIADSVPNPAAPIVFPTNFPEEFFYWTANARIRPLAGSNSFRADLTIALEGAFGGATGGVVNGEQTTFARFRFRVNGGFVPGATYTVTYPFGVKTFVASATGTINFTDDQGCGAAPPPATSPTFWRRPTSDRFSRGTRLPPAPPAGFIGDANVDHAITGSPFGTNFLRITGPNVGGPGINTIQTNLFSVTGKIFNGVLATALTIDRTSFARTAASGSEIDLFAHSAGNATIVGSATGIPTTTLTKDAATGRFFARIVSTTVPRFVRYTATSPGNDPTVRDSQVIDEVTVTRATYSLGTRVLTVNATSSDQVGAPTLTAAGSPLEPLGTLTGGALVVTLTAPPYQVNVTSSAGGTGSLLVDLTP